MARILQRQLVVDRDRQVLDALRHIGRLAFKHFRDTSRKVIASNGYRELGMFEDAAQALEEIEPEQTP